MPMPDEAAIGWVIGNGSEIRTGGGASTNGRTHPPVGAWAAVAALAATVVADAPHNAVAEACEPKMLSSTIGLIVRAGAAAADASVGLATSATATTKVVIFMDTPPSIYTLPNPNRGLR